MTPLAQRCFYYLRDLAPLSKILDRVVERVGATRPDNVGFYLTNVDQFRIRDAESLVTQLSGALGVKPKMQSMRKPVFGGQAHNSVTLYQRTTYCTFHLPEGEIIVCVSATPGVLREFTITLADSVSRHYR